MGYSPTVGNVSNETLVLGGACYFDSIARQESGTGVPGFGRTKYFVESAKCGGNVSNETLVETFVEGMGGAGSLSTSPCGSLTTSFACRDFRVLPSAPTRSVASGMSCRSSSSFRTSPTVPAEDPISPATRGSLHSGKSRRNVSLSSTRLVVCSPVCG